MFALCPKSYKTCELINTRPWSKDLGNQCTMAYYHCSKKTCDEVKTWSEKRKLCDPIKCEPYEVYDHKLKCCIKSNHKLKEYKKQTKQTTNISKGSKTRINKTLKGFNKGVGGSPVYINEKNRKFCRNSRSRNGEICFMTYQNARYFCETKAKKLPSVNTFKGLINSKNSWGFYNWSTIKLYTISPDDTSVEYFSYEYQPSHILDILVYKKKLLNNKYKSEVFTGYKRGIWVGEYCYEEEKIAYDRHGRLIASTCKYSPSNGVFSFGHPPIESAAVFCIEDK